MSLVTSLANELKNQSITSESLVNQCFDTIDQTDSTIQAIITPLRNAAITQAKAIDSHYKKGNPLPPFAGVPITLKDNLNVKGHRTTCASNYLENYISTYDATAVKKCTDSGLIPIAKVNLDEFAMGSSTENSAFKTTRNPWHIDHVPGGSSGGSAASVAANYAPWSLGSDTGGSIRQPAAYCGVVGLKPTYGRVSRYGLVAFASSLDQIGPITKTVEDAAILLTIISGHDPYDSTSSNQPTPDFTQRLNQDIKGLKIAVPKQLIGDGIHPDVIQSVQEALDTYKTLGATVDIIDFDAISCGISTYYIIAPAEVSSNLSRFDGVRYGHRSTTATTLKDMYIQSRSEGFGSEVKRRIMLGTFVLSSGYYDAYYKTAQKARRHVKQAFNTVFKDYDVIMSPTAPGPAFKIGELVNDPLSMYLTDMCTIPANLAGLPALSIPCGFSNALPIGLQLVTPAFSEDRLLQIAHQFQQCTSFHTQQPKDNQ